MAEARVKTLGSLNEHPYSTDNGGGDSDNEYADSPPNPLDYDSDNSTRSAYSLTTYRYTESSTFLSLSETGGTPGTSHANDALGSRWTTSGRPSGNHTSDMEEELRRIHSVLSSQNLENNQKLAQMTNKFNWVMKRLSRERNAHPFAGRLLRQFRDECLKNNQQGQ